MHPARRLLAAFPTRPRCRSRGRVSLPAGVLAAATLVTSMTPASAQPAGGGGQLEPWRANPPPYYAIQNARIVTVSGQTLESGTIVLADGVIQAVGVDVPVPEDAWVVDGTGLTVYPGLVDALGTLALPQAHRRPRAGAGRGAARAGGGGGEGSQQEHARGAEDRPATLSWVAAADELVLDDDRVEEWREAGFTTAVTAPDRGIFSGQAAVIGLAGERPRDMVLHTPAALRVNLDKGPGFPGYPANLLGVIAYLRQTFLDARHYGQAWQVYEASPRGRARPEHDRALAPINEALSAARPVLLPAHSRKEIDRVLRLAREWEVTPLLYGLHEGYAAADLLRDAGAAALVSLDWPRAPEDGDPDAEPTLEELRLRDRAPTTPARLHEAGVRFAFYSDGVRRPADALAGVRKAVAAGLPPEAAVRALTLTPAELFGVADRLGSLDSGKLANVLVTEGDLLSSEARVRMVFVDGRMFEPGPRTAAERGNEEARSGAPAARTAATTQGAEGTPGEVEPGETGAASRSADGAQEPYSTVPQRFADPGPLAPAEVTLIQNATVLTAANGRLENASVLIRDGKIAAVGPDVAAPAGARVVDATGRYVIPGIIDAHSHLAADGINEGSVSVSSMVGIEDVLDPDDIGIYRALAGGVTAANILHGSANPIGGKNAVIKLRWGADARDLLVDGAPPGIKFALGENPKRDRTPDRYPSTRMGVMDVIRQAFVEAAEYRDRWSEHERRRRAGERNLIPPRRDVRLEPLVEILEGRRLVHAHSYRADEILALLRVAEEFGFRIASLQHVLEGYKVADEIAAHGAGASTFSDWWAYKVEAYDAIPHNAALMTERGVVASINSDSGEEIRHLNQEAAKAMKWGGLSEEEALRLVTLNPAKQLGIEDRMGSIEVGKDADLAIYEGHPLSMYGVVQQTYVDGRLYFDRAIDRERRALLAEEKEALLEKLGEEGRPGPRPVTDASVVAVPEAGR